MSTRSEIYTDITSDIDGGGYIDRLELSAILRDIVASATFPVDLGAVATSNDYNDLDNLPVISGAGVSDTAYGVSWDAVTDEAPSKNAVYDKIEALDAAKADASHTHTKSDITDFSEGDYATAAQGALADTAVQPGDLETIATTGSFNDILDNPVSDALYGIDWDGNLGVPTKNAVYDKISVMISDAAYDSSWNGVGTVAPSKNAVYDKIETLDTAKVNTSRSVATGTGLSGGGDLSADRTIALSSGSQASLALADTALQQTTALKTVSVTSSRTLTSNDINALLIVNSSSPVTLTVDSGIFSAGHVVNILTVGTGDVIIADGTATVSVASSATQQLAEPGCLASLIFTSGSAARLVGELAAA